MWISILIQYTHMVNHKNTPQRFMAKVTPTSSGCWEYRCALDRNGYAKLMVNGRLWKAHRYSYEIHRGHVPDGMTIDHLCLNKACVNPWHLEIVTRSENKRRDGFRSTACRKGHPWTEENTYWYKMAGREHLHRRCKTCWKEYDHIRWITGQR